MKGVIINNNQNYRVKKELSLFLTSLAVVVLFLVAGCSQQSTSSTALEPQIKIVETANNAMKNLKWDEYASLIHPDDLIGFRMLLMPEIERMIVTANTDSISLFGKMYNSAELQNQSPDVFFTEMMNTVFGLSPELGMTFQGMENENVGALAEGDSLVHVVVRTKMNIGGRNISEMNVATLSKYENNWKLALSNKIEGIAMMLQQSLQMAGR